MTARQELDAITLAVQHKIGRRHSDVDDVASDCWIKLDRLRSKYDSSRASPHTYISQIVSSAVIDSHRRTASRHRRETACAVDSSDTVVPEEIDDPSVGPHAAALESARETYRAVHALVGNVRVRRSEFSLPTRAALGRLRDMIGSRTRATLMRYPAFRRDIRLPRIPGAAYFCKNMPKRDSYSHVVAEYVQPVVVLARENQRMGSEMLETLPRRKYTVPTHEAAKIMGWSVEWMRDRAREGKFSFYPGSPHLFAMEELIEYEKSRVVPRVRAEREIIIRR